MRSLAAFAVLLALLTALPQAAAHQTVMGTSSTGDQDTWGIPDPVPTFDRCSFDVGKVHADAVCIEPQMCPQDIYWFTVTLELLDPSPSDVVALTVAGDAPGLGASSYNIYPSNIDPSGMTFQADPDTYPTAVATYDDPVAEVTVQLGGCNRATTAIVSGVVVDGEVAYELRY